MKREELLALQERVIHALSAEGSADGIDPARLGMVRELAKAKRLAKIEYVLPRTCRALREDFSRLGDDFAHAMPPTSFRSRADALAFYRFLSKRRAAREVLDLAYCELAISAQNTRSSDERRNSLSIAPGSIAIRRAPGVRLRTCQFDVRPFFEDGSAGMPATVRQSPVHLAILADPQAGTPRIVQLSAGLFDLVSALRGWRLLPGVTNEETKRLLDDLQQQGLLEIARASE